MSLIYSCKAKQKNIWQFPRIASNNSTACHLGLTHLNREVVEKKARHYMNNSQNNQRGGKSALGSFSLLALFKTGGHWKVKLRILATTTVLTVIWPGAWAFGQSDPYKIWMLAEIAGQYAEVGQKDKAAELLAQALPLVQDISDDCNKPKPIAAIARQYAAAGQEAKSSQLLAQAIQMAKTAKGCSSNDDVLENLGDIAEWYWENQQYDQALQILRELDDDTMKAVALAYYAPKLAEVGRANQATAVLAEALQIAQTIDKTASKAVALSRIADHTIKLGHNAQAVKVLDQLLQTAQNVNDDFYVSRLVDIAGKYIQVGKKTQAIKVLSQALSNAQTIENSFFKIYLAQIAVQYAKAGQLDQALQVVQTLDNTNSKVHALVEIAGEYVGENQKVKANELLSQALELSQTLNDSANKAGALSRIARHYAEAGQLDQALQIVKTISDAEQKASVLNVISDHYVQTGQLEQAIRVAQTIDNNTRYKVIALLQVADRYAEAGKLEQAIRVTQTIEGNVFNKVSALSRIASYYLKAKQIDQALQTAQAIEALSVEHNNTDSILLQIVGEYAKVGQFDQALQVTQTIKGKPNQVKALSAIAGQYAARSQKEKASEILNQAVQIVQARQPVQ